MRKGSLNFVHLTPFASLGQWKNAVLAGLTIFLFSAVWLYLRRWGTPLSEVYIKLSFAGLAVAGTALIAMSYLFGSLAHFWPEKWEAKKELRKYYGLFGFYLILMHSAWGVLLKVPLTKTPFIFGIIGLLIFTIVAVASLRVIAQKMKSAWWLFFQRLGYLALILGTIHFGLLKWKGWLAVSDWPYFLPPLSLLLFVFIAFVLIIRLATLISGRRYETKTQR